MPSCVVKCCHNNSSLSKKTQGITFHRFPKANEAWKDDWIQIIRKCRNENCWNPSKSSVICSIHFESEDLYITKGGLRRVRLYGVPKKLLFEPPASQDEDEQLSCDSLFKDSTACEATPTTSKQQLLGQGQACFKGTTLPSPQLVEMIPSTSGQQVIKEEKTDLSVEVATEQHNRSEKSVDINSSNATSEDSSACEPTTSKQQLLGQGQACFKGTTLPSPQLVEMIPSTSGQQVIKEEKTDLSVEVATEQHNRSEKSVDINSSNDPSEVLHASASTTVKTEVEETLTVLYTPRKRRLKQTIIKMQIEMKNKNIKIKNLNQKIRRLKKRNQSLKNILKTFKDEN